MRKRLTQCVSMMLAFCMLWTLLPALGLAREEVASDVPAQSLETEEPAPTAEASLASKPEEMEALVEATNGPVEATESPADVTAAPVEATEVPVEATEVPVEATEAPAEATEVPAEATEVPVEATEIPAEATEVPAEATEVPVEATEVPTATPEMTAEPTPTLPAEALEPCETPTPAPTLSEEVLEPCETPAPTAEAVRIVSFDLSELPEGIAVPCGLEETDLGLPTTLTAMFSDGTSAPVAVVWVCVGEAYNPMPEDPAAQYTFQAALAEDILCDAEMPMMGVVFMEMPMLMAAADELAQYGISGDGTYTIGPDSYYGNVITLTSGTFAVDSSSTDGIAIHVNGSATLTANADVNGYVEVNGGTASLQGISEQLTVNGGSATVTSATVRFIRVKGGETTLNNVTVPSGIAVNGGSLTVTGSATNVPEISPGGGTASVTVTGGAHIPHIGLSSSHTVSVISASVDAVSCGEGKLIADKATIGEANISYSGECDIRNSSITTLRLEDNSAKRDVVDTEVDTLILDPKYIRQYTYWPKDGSNYRVPAAGESAAGYSYEVKLDSFQYSSRGSLRLNYQAPIKIIYTPDPASLVDGCFPAAGTTVTFNVQVLDGKGKNALGENKLTAKFITENYTAPLTLTGGTLTKTYDGTPNFTGGVVKNPTWKKENWDGSFVDYTGVTGDVTVSNFAVASKNVGTYAYTPETLTFPEAPAGTTFATTMPTLTAEITKAPVTLSGTFGRHYFPTTLDKVADQILSLGLAPGETLTDLGITKLTDDAGRDLLDNMYDDMGKTVDVTKVECKPDTNYEVMLQNLRMIVYYATFYNVTMPDAYIGLGAPPFPEPELTLDTSLSLPDDRSVKYEYAEEGTENWSEKPPTTEGKYEIRVTLGKYGDYFTEEVGIASFNVSKIYWNGRPMYPTEVPYGDEIKVQLKPFGPRDDILAYQKNGYIEVDFEGTTYRGEYDAGATDGYPFTVTLPTEGIVTQCKYYELPIRFYLPVSEGSDEYQLAATSMAYVEVVKKDISRNFSANWQQNGTYWGVGNTSGAMIEVYYIGSPSINLAQTDILDVSITRNGAAHEPLKYEMETFSDRCYFSPQQAGEYVMTVRVKEDNPFYTGSCTGKCSVAKRKLVVHANDATMERGKRDFNCGYTLQEETSLADFETLSFSKSYTHDQLEDLPVGEHPFTMTDIHVWGSWGMETTDSYDISQCDPATGEDHQAILTVTPKSGNFTIVIPPTASVSDGGMTIQCAEIDANLSVSVKVQSRNGFILSDAESGGEVPYDLCREGAKLSNGNVAAQFTAADQTQALTFQLPGDGKPAIGVYTDTLTFTATID